MAALDLLSWPDFHAERQAYEAELDDAAMSVQTALAAYEETLRRNKRPPAGEVRWQREALKRATTRVLAAELHYAELKRREPTWP